MTRPNRTVRSIGAILLAAIVVAGCGGGEEVVAADPNATPVPGAETPGAVVAGTDPNAIPAATDPNAVPGAAGAAAAGATATVPDLSGGDVGGGGFGDLSGVAAFQPGAVDTALPAKTTESKDQLPEKDVAPSKAATIYTGAVISVDGVTHTITTRGTFPKGTPVFRLLAVTADSVEIQLVAGELTANGGNGFYLDKGDTISAVNASEQVTYSIRYVRPMQDTSGITL
ncbi:MAG: hypothetical protein JWM90_1415 [Thermoleophilia bacterium]|nr:hypothetical protein [Thermoleophilia bacterium]